MKRMWSRNELQKLIGSFIEGGAVDSYINSLIDASIEDGAIKTELDKKADLSGANFSGAITSPSIIEDMIGYSFSNNVIENITNEVSYAGVVKNGNKLTLTIVGKLTRTGSVDTNVDIGIFSVPTSITGKLNNVNIGSTSALAFGKIYLASAYNAGVDLPVLTFKTNTTIYPRFYNVNANLTLNTEYGYRYEITFLLSENLVPSGE